MAESDQGRGQELIEEKKDRTFSSPAGALHPTFFIGIGGCGSKIVQNIRGYVKGMTDARRYDNLVHFMAFDTDAGDLKALNFSNTYLISDFPKGEYVALKQGREYKKADPFFTQWWPDWYASRPDSVKGAGQIRVESRLSLYYQLENDRNQIIQDINGLILRSKDHDNPWRRVRPPIAYCHIFCSIAGGTGSGGLLTLAYLMQELLTAQRLSPKIVAHIVLPTLFYRKVRSRLHPDIRANGYAALKEIEWFQTLGYNNSPRMTRGSVLLPTDDALDFNYNPFSRPESGNIKVKLPPFASVNIIDQPGDFAFAVPEQIYPAIAGAAFAQLFSPILSRQESEEDNYYKKIKHLENGFSCSYGTYGLSMLVLPDKEILNYCAYRMAASALQAQKSGSDSSLGDLKDQLLRRAVDELKAAKDHIGDALKEGVLKLLRDAGVLEQWLAEDPSFKDLATGVKAETAGDALATGGELGMLRKLLEKRRRALEEAVDVFRKKLDSLESQVSLPREPDKPIKTILSGIKQGCATTFDAAKKGFEESLTNGTKVLVNAGKDAISGTRNVSPVARRLALSVFITELAAPDGTSSGADLPYNPFDVESLKSTLTEMHDKKLLERVGGEDDWVGAKSYVHGQLRNQLADSNVMAEAQAYAMHELTSALRDACQAQLQRDQSAIDEADEVIKALNNKANAAKNNSEGMAREYVLDAEVLQGVRSGQKYWDRLYYWLADQSHPLGPADLQMEKGNDSPTVPISAQLELLEQLKQGLAELKSKSKDERGKPADPTPSAKRAVVEAIAVRWAKHKLTPYITGKRKAGDQKELKGLLIDRCLWLEAKWELEHLFIEDHLVNFQGLITDEQEKHERHTIASEHEPTREAMIQYVEEKIKFIAEKSRLLARLRLTEGTAVDTFVFVGASSHYGDPLRDHHDREFDSLTDIIRRSHSLLKGARSLPGWVDEKRIAFYQGQTGVPIHNFWPVNGELKESYEQIYREYVTGHERYGKPKRDFPSHTDKNFEDPGEWDPHTVLPSLDPYRNVAAGTAGEQGFWELLAYGLIAPHWLPDTARKLDVRSKAEALWQASPWKASDAPAGEGAPASVPVRLPTIPKLLSVSRVQPTPLQRRKLQRSLEDAQSRHIDDRDAGSQYLLSVPRKEPGYGEDPVLHNARPGYSLALGGRVDRAVEKYRLFSKGANKNRAEQAQMTDALKRKKELMMSLQDPEPFNAWMKGLVVYYQQRLSEAEDFADQGHRVEDLVKALRQGVGHLQNIYRKFKGTDAH